jgi:MoaA/NifB/PqqE/SkfB family radical SAM enzyme
MEYDIEANWELLSTCNFRCDYCFLSDKALGKKIDIKTSPNQWAKSFEDTGKTWLLNMLGGELLIYPNFVDLCELLTKRHYLTIGTNLSRQNVVMDFAARINPERVYYIYASLHWTERQRKNGLQAFIAGVKALKNFGFTVVIAQVMTHEAIAAFKDIQAAFEPHGLTVFPKPARSKARNGDKYPASYSAEEIAAIGEYDSQARIRYAAEVKSAEAPTPSTIFDKDGKFIVSNFPWYLGKLCAAGFKFVRILPNGDVIRCASWQKLGNMLDGTFQANNGPRICYTRYCAFFCEKYTQPEFTGSTQKFKIIDGAGSNQFNITDISDL